MSSRTFFEGAKDTLPLILAAMPFGVVYGAMATSQGLPVWLIMCISLMVFAGASQFIAIALLATQTPVSVIVLTVFIVNLRHMLYAITLIPFVSNVAQRLRIPMAFTLTDETFAVVFNRMMDQQANSHAQQHVAHYYLGSSLIMYLNWQLCTLFGVLAGNQFPALTEFGLDIAMVVAFIGIVVPHLKLPSHWLCAIVACVAGTLTYHWPNQTGLLFSTFLAIAVGVTSEGLVNKRTPYLKEQEHE